MGFTNSVPAGIYGRAALTSLGLWEGVVPFAVEVDNVRAALMLVARGEVPLGIVYQSDALVVPNLPIVARFPTESHPQISYFAAVTSQSNHPDAAAFVDHLRGVTARTVFDNAGFCTDRRWC
jgi:molybdate transport system substrate-binding protein